MRTKNWHDERFIAHEGIGHKAVAEAVAAAGAAETIDFDDGLFHTLTLDENVTLTFANEPDDSTVIVAHIRLIQDATGTNTVTWPANVTWDDDTAPTITADGDAQDIVRLTKVPGTDDWIGEVLAADITGESA